MAVFPQFTAAVVVATLAMAPVLAGSSVAQQAGTDNPPPGVTVLESAQASGPAGERKIATPGSENNQPAREKQAAEGKDAKGRINPKYDVSKIGNREIGRGLNIYSVEREQRRGKELASELDPHLKLLDDPLVDSYVKQLVERLVQNSDAKIPFTVKVIDDAEVNAFSFPGGFLYVHTGLIFASDNEAELAAVIAHEVAHVAARHGTRSASRAFVWNIASFPLVFAGGAGLAVRQVAGLVLPVSMLKFSRDAEREADLLGVEYQYAAGYDPVALIDIFERLRANERNNSSRLSRLFFCHPTTGDRIQRAQQAILTYLPPRDRYVINTSAFDEVKARLEYLRLAGVGKPGRPVLLRRTAPTHQGDPGPTEKPN